jgi:hypothetical protein
MKNTCTCGIGSRPYLRIKRGSSVFLRTHRRASCPAWTPAAAAALLALWGRG